MIAEKNSLESRITMKVNQKFKNNREKNVENNRKLVLGEQYPNNGHHRKRKLRERNNGRII